MDAVARAHGEPIYRLPADWESIMKGFELKYGVNILEYYLPTSPVLKPSTRRSTKAGFDLRRLRRW